MRFATPLVVAAMLPAAASLASAQDLHFHPDRQQTPMTDCLIMESAPEPTEAGDVSSSGPNGHYTCRAHDAETTAFESLHVELL